MKRAELSRRELLVLGGAGCAVGLLHCGGFGGVSIPSTLSAGPASAMAAGTLQIVSGYPLAVGRDAGGYYAISLICTHADCDMSFDGTVSTSGIECFCHGSVFSANGVVLRGPARAPLAHYLVSIDASGNLIVHGDQTVASTTRVS